MALNWLRSNQKRVLIPLTILIIVTFVFLYGMDGGPGGGSGEIVVAVEGQKVTRQEYVEYQRALASMRDPRAPYRRMMEAAAARKIGLGVGPEELRDAIRSWVRVRRPDAERVTENVYREELGAWGITPSVLERVMTDYVLSFKLMQIGGQAGYVTDHEAYLAYSREKLRMEISYADFAVDDFLDQVEEPSEEDIVAAFNEAAALEPTDPMAYASEPKAAIEYVLFSGEKAAESAEKLRQTLQSLGAEGIAGPLGELAGGVESAALAASREASIREHYERTKALYRLPDAEDDEGGEPAEPRYQPLDKVRDRIERELAQSAGPGAASARAKDLLKGLDDQARLDLLGPSAVTAGIGAVHHAAAVMSEQSVKTAVFFALGEEMGGARGATGLRTREQLSSIENLGRTQNLAEDAIKRGGQGDFNPAGPTWVQNGYAVWRVAGYEAPRKLALDEAREEVVSRIRRERAVELARVAADEFLEKLETGELTLSALDKSRTLAANIPQGEPFVRLAVHELPVEPAAFDQQGRSAEFQSADAGLFRVGVVTERDAPTKAEFEADESWRQRSRTAMLMDVIRSQYVSDAWRLDAIDKVDGRVFVQLE